MIIIETILRESPKTDLVSKFGFRFDVTMLNVTSGGKERTYKEYKNLVKGAGFTACKLVSQRYELASMVV